MNGSTALIEQLTCLKLQHGLEHHEDVAQQAARASWSHLHFLSVLLNGEVNFKQEKATQRRIRLARFPVIKTLAQFQWDWPKKMNQLQVKHLFRLQFIEDKSNVIFPGGVGPGKTHLGIALAYQACLQGHSVYFISAVDLINSLNASQKMGRLKTDIKKYLKPALLFIDEPGYLPFDKNGVSWLFQVISQRYEKGSITTCHSL
jgi:DNA replication protein DnaC